MPRVARTKRRKGPQVRWVGSINGRRRIADTKEENKFAGLPISLNAMKGRRCRHGFHPKTGTFSRDQGVLEQDMQASDSVRPEMTNLPSICVGCAFPIFDMIPISIPRGLPSRRLRLETRIRLDLEPQSYFGNLLIYP